MIIDEFGTTAAEREVENWAGMAREAITKIVPVDPVVGALSAATDLTCAVCAALLEIASAIREHTAEGSSVRRPQDHAADDGVR